MFIDNTLKWINIHAPFTAPDGTHGIDLTRAENREKYGIRWIADPVPPTPPEGLTLDEAFSRDETPDRMPPYITWDPRKDEQILAALTRKYEAALDAHLDEVAREHRYDNRFTFALRAGYQGPFQAEGVAFAQWMDACNAQVYALLQSVVAGTTPRPTVAAFIAGLPAFVV